MMSSTTRLWPNGEPQTVRELWDNQPGIAAAFSDEAAAQLREKYGEREREQLAAARDMTPGAPHPDPVLAAKGWQASGHGTYIRHPPEAQREAG
jgi:hypothetical protein